MLRELTGADLSNAAYPFMTARDLAVGDVPVRALRVTFVGELGWELYAPAEYGLGLWTALWEAGREHGLVAAGYRAIESLRLEKGYRVWSTDITPETDPYEAGLGFCVKLDKPGGFEGRDALVATKAAGATRRLRCLVLADPRVVALGSEPVRVGRRGGRPGHVRRLRLHDRRVDRVRLPAGRPREARHRGRGERLRRLGGRRRSSRSRWSTRPAAGSAPTADPSRGR